MSELKRTLVVLTAGLVLFAVGCENEEIGSLNNTPPVSTAQPVVSSVVPVGTAQAGVDTMIITGSNFSTDMSKNIVYFNSTPAVIIDGSATQLRVKIPLVIDDSTRLRIAVQSSDLLSETVYYNLTAAIQEFGGLTQSEAAAGITTDAAGNLYVAISSVGSDMGVFKITPAGVKTAYAPATVGVAAWSSIRWGPNDTVYALRNVRTIFYYPPGGSGSAVAWLSQTLFPVGTSLADLDFDVNDYMWVVGTNTLSVANARIFCVKPNKTITFVPFAAALKSVRVYNGFLYFAGTQGSTNGIWRAQILNDSLATPTLYFDLSTAYGSENIAFGMGMASDGTIFLGTDTPEGVVVLHQSGASSAPYGAYLNLLTPGARTFAWGPGDALYVAANSGKLLKLASRMTSAPYFGTQ